MRAVPGMIRPQRDLETVSVDSAKAARMVQPSDSGSIPASTLHFWFGETSEAMDLVERFHYTARWPAAVQFIVTAHLPGGLFGNKGICVGAAAFTIPGTRWSEPLLELSRLVRHDDYRFQLTAMVASGLNKIRRDGEWDLVVSFADAQRHHGGVYQAGGWTYHGLRGPAMEGVMVDDAFVPGRSANHRWGTRSPERLQDRGIAALAVWDEGKHLFWRSLNSTGRQRAERLGLLSRSYFKPKQQLGSQA